MKPIYLDYNASTPICEEAAEKMRPLLNEYFGNPSSSHYYGRQTKAIVETARSQVAGFLNCTPEEIVFTSGGTESNNFAIMGTARRFRNKGRRLITSAAEHPAVTEVCKYLENEGFETSYIPVDEYGIVDLQTLEKSIRQDTVLISVMHANNEVGTIQPITEIAHLAQEYGIIFHTDAAQSAGKISVDVKELGADLLSIAGHKLYAPKGIGALYIRAGIELDKIMHGAPHESNRRPGTENVLEIAGLGAACDLANEQLETASRHTKEMRELLYRRIMAELPDTRLNGHPEQRLPNTLSLGFPGIRADELLDNLPEIAASPGAACHSDTAKISSVLQAMNVPLEYAMGTVRFSTGKYTTSAEIETASKLIIGAVQSMRSENK